MPEEKKKKTEEKKTKKTTKPREANADATGTTPGLAETMVRDQQTAAVDRANQVGRVIGETPLTEQDVAASALGLLPSGDPATTGQMPAPGAQPMQPAAPIEQPGLGETILAGTLGAIPLFGNLFQEPYRRARAERERQLAVDKSLFDNALAMMDTNPDAAAEVMKAPGVKDAFQRHARMSPQDVQAFSQMAQNLPIKASEFIQAVRAGFEPTTDEGKTSLQGPGGVGLQAPKGERERLAGVRASLEDIYSRQGKDPRSITDLDVQFFDAQSAAGKNRYQMQATRKGIGFVDMVTGDVQDITPDALRSSNMEVVPIEDGFGGAMGYTIVDLDDINNRQEIWFKDMVDDLKAEFLAEQNLSPQNASPEQVAEAEKKANDQVFKQVLNLGKEVVTGQQRGQTLPKLLRNWFFEGGQTREQEQTATKPTRPTRKQRAKSAVDKYF